MPISGIGGAPGITPIEFPKIDTGGSAGAKGTSGADFGNKLTDAIGNLQGAQTKSDTMATQMATGQLTDVHDYMIAANEASIATQLTVAVKNKAVESFNQIMNMQV